MIRKIVSASILVFSFVLCTTNDVSAQTQSSNTPTAQTKTNGKIRITTMSTPLANDATTQEPSIAQLQADIQNIEANIAIARQNPELVANGTLAKHEQALLQSKAALKEKQEAQR